MTDTSNANYPDEQTQRARYEESMVRYRVEFARYERGELLNPPPRPVPPHTPGPVWPK